MTVCNLTATLAQCGAYFAIDKGNVRKKFDQTEDKKAPPDFHYSVTNYHDLQLFKRQS